MSKQTNILELNLKGKWFKMIEEGVKLEEYREIKPHWINALYYINPINMYEFEDLDLLADELTKGLEFKQPFWKYTHIRFSNGYAKNRPQFDIELLGITIGTGKEEWGAEQGKEYFVLQLGEISNRKNIWEPMYTEEQLLNTIDRWHNGNSQLSLIQYLGFTYDEYANYITNGTIPLRECAK